MAIIRAACRAVFATGRGPGPVVPGLTDAYAYVNTFVYLKASDCMRPRRLTREDRREQTCARLRSSAISAFARHGIAGARIETIAEEAGYSRGAFYSNYKTKQDLLLDLLRERQIGEIQQWRDILGSSTDLDRDLALLAARYDDRDGMHENGLLGLELLLEAERNPEFRPSYEAYLDAVYAEMRLVFEVLFARHGKRLTYDFDALLVSNRLLGLGLRMPVTLGRAIAERLSPGQIMLEFLKGVIASAPDIDPAAA